jgi:hypothetical protein
MCKGREEGEGLTSSPAETSTRCRFTCGSSLSTERTGVSIPAPNDDLLINGVPCKSATSLSLRYLSPSPGPRGVSADKPRMESAMAPASSDSSAARYALVAARRSRVGKKSRLMMCEREAV